MTLPPFGMDRPVPFRQSECSFLGTPHKWSFAFCLFSFLELFLTLRPKSLLKHADDLNNLLFPFPSGVFYQPFGPSFFASKLPKVLHCFYLVFTLTPSNVFVFFQALPDSKSCLSFVFPPPPSFR